MSVWRVQNAGGGTNGGIAGRLAAVLSLGAHSNGCDGDGDGDGDGGSKRQKRTFQYGEQYEGTVRGEPVPDTSEPTTRYYVEMDSVDSMPEPNKFYFRNMRTRHPYRSPVAWVLEAEYEGVKYRFIHKMLSHQGGLSDAIDPVFKPGTRVRFIPIPINVFKAEQVKLGERGLETVVHEWPVPGGMAATTVQTIEESAASSHTEGGGDGEGRA